MSELAVVFLASALPAEPILRISLHRLALARARFAAPEVFQTSIVAVRQLLDQAIDGLKQSGRDQDLPRGLIAHAQLCAASGNVVRARLDLDEAWEIAERGPMKLHMADIHLTRVRLFFREKSYPWISPQDDLAAAEKLINACGYHRRDEELADAKRAILGSSAEGDFPGPAERKIP